EEVKDGVEVCVFDESPEVFSRAVHAISELTAGEPEPNFPDAEVERLASSITFLREWRHLSYEPKNVSFTCDARSAPSRVDTHKINLPQFSSASVPQITHLDDGKAKTDSYCLWSSFSQILLYLPGAMFGHWTGALGCVTGLILP
ncbi:Os07g0454400, partial [Oryza sativa Japonica Group]